MFKRFKLNTFLFIIPLTTLIFCFNSPKNDDEKMQTIMISVRNTLTYLHYNPKPINDAYSQNVFTKYLETVDPAKRYFLQSDIDEFAKHKTKLDDYFIGGNLLFYNLTYDRLYKRIEEIEKATQDILSKSINLDEDESFVLEPKKKVHPKNAQEQYNEWKKYIKYNILQEIETLNSREESQKKKKDSVQKNHLQDTIKLEILSAEQKQAKATQEVKDLLAQSFKRLKKRKKMDWFRIYMNAYTEVFDPHTSYFSPKDKEDFDNSFKGSFIGIGAIIQEKKGNIYFGALTIGAPAWKSKQLSDGDRLLKIRSKPNEEFVNVVGMLSEEAVRLIRGEKGTKVTLVVEKKDKSIKEVTLVREEVEIEDTFAKSVVIDVPDGKKYGFIHLPSFNTDFDNAKNRNASDDIKNEINKLKEYNIDGIILDLRSNGGGSLTEVGDLMNLFMPNGAYVQVKEGNGKINTYKSKGEAPIWNGSLVVMQSEFSASASEIFAGLVQDYGRGVVVGSPQSYGKGTVQTFVDLNRLLNVSDDFGSLKLTIQKFYRVSGESTQRKGVASDIQMNDLYTDSEIGERYDDYALSWDKIAPVANFTPKQFPKLPELQKHSADRLAKNQTYKLIQESAKWKESLNKEEVITLNREKFDALMKQRKEQIKKFEVLNKYTNGLKFTRYPSELQREKTDEAFKKKTEAWLKNLQKDIYLQEAVSIISEMK